MAMTYEAVQNAAEKNVGRYNQLNNPFCSGKLVTQLINYAALSRFVWFG